MKNYYEIINICKELKDKLSETFYAGIKIIQRDLTELDSFNPDNTLSTISFLKSEIKQFESEVTRVEESVLVLEKQNDLTDIKKLYAKVMSEIHIILEDAYAYFKNVDINVINACHRKGQHIVVSRWAVCMNNLSEARKHDNSNVARLLVKDLIILANDTKEARLLHLKNMAKYKKTPYYTKIKDSAEITLRTMDSILEEINYILKGII
jgi:hypothetical protein